MNNQSYDSTNDTNLHIGRVQDMITLCADLLELRAMVHDDSKLKSPEKEVFDEMTPKLKGSTYGSEEYKGFLASMKVALDHHYSKNSHHPEHFTNGINGMSLFDLLEMTCDWKAAGERHADGSIERSLTVNKERFNIGDQLYEILQNTARELERYNWGVLPLGTKNKKTPY